MCFGADRSLHLRGVARLPWPASAQRPQGAGAARSEAGQALVLGLLMLAATMAGALAILGIATVVAMRAAAQSAADAAALACAADATLVRQVDARGVVYGVTAEVSAGGPSAARAAWAANAKAWPLRVVSFHAVPSADTCAVSVRLAARIGALEPAGGGSVTWTTSAVARAYPPAA